MNIEIVNKLDEIIELLNNDKENRKLKKLKEKIFKNEELINDINRLKEINSFDDNYVLLKKKILEDNDYKKYKEIETDLYFLVKDMNNKLNKLVETGGCR